MHIYQLFAIALMIALGLVVHSTVRLNDFRKQRQIERTLINTRDFQVLRQPRKYPEEEVRLVRIHWGACAATLVLALTTFALLPPELLEQLQATP